MLELEDRYLCEQLRLNMGAAVRLLEAAGTALDRRDAALGRAVLGFESVGDPGMRPLPRAVRADAMVEMVTELAMRAAELARVAWRPGSDAPPDQAIADVVVRLSAVARSAAATDCADLGRAAALAYEVRTAHAAVAALLRVSDPGRPACLAS
jgi:hypothetical protein